MTRILVAHAPAAKARAADVAEALSALGYKVETRAGKTLSPLPRAVSQAVSGAAQVLVLWSREAAGSPGMLAAARAAQAGGKLSLALLDKAAPPALFKGAIDLSNWAGAPRAPAWRRLAASLPAADKTAARPQAVRAPIAAPVPAAPAKKSGGAGFVFALVLGLLVAAGAALYALL